MAPNTFARLLAALADATPAFTPPSEPDGGGRGRRLLIALADATPTFQPRGTPPGVATRAAAAAPTDVADLGPTGLEQVVQRLVERTPQQRLESRISVPIDWIRLIRVWAQLLIKGEELAAALDDLMPRARARHLTKRRVNVLAVSLSNEIVDGFDRESTDVRYFMEPVAYPYNAHEHFISRVTILSSMLSAASKKRPLERVDEEVTKAHELALDVVHTLNLVLGKLLAPPEPPVDRPLGTEEVRAITDGFRAYDPLRGTKPANPRHSPDVVVDPRYSPGRLISALDRLETAVSDFTDADLSEVNLRGLRLRGVQWSMLTTHWPPGWTDPIRAVSQPIDPDRRPDLYEIRSDPEMPVRQTVE